MDGDYDEKNNALFISSSIKIIFICKEIILSSIQSHPDYLHYSILDFHHLDQLMELVQILWESHIWGILTIPSEDYNHI